jgi:serine/threonine-protein kinase
MASGPNSTAGRRVVRLGKYDVIAHIATGGMGAVYRARDTETGREVALKVLSPEMASKAAMVERFRREAKHAGKLKHENIVELYEFDKFQNTYYLAMEFVDGMDLHEYVKRKGPLDPEEARVIILQGCRALRHAFDKGVVHRDVKPSNFLLARKKGKPLVKLTDLGLAREASNDEFRVTRAGTTVGTLDYMAPEQARDSGKADIRSDLYSLGATWYHLLTGHALFPEGGLAERLYKIMNEEPPDPRDSNPRVSEETWNVLGRLLAKDPDERYQEPAELIEDLLALEGRAAVVPPSRAEEEQKKARPKKGGPRAGPAEDTDADRPLTAADGRRSRLWIGVAAATAVLLVVGLVALLGSRNKHRARPADQAGTTPTQPAQAPIIPPSQPPPKIGTKEEKKPSEVEKKPRWASLSKGREKIDADALRKKIEAPWTARPAPGAAPVVLRIGRAAASLPQPSYLSLAEACAAAPPDRPIVLEVHDNGPLFEVAAAVAGRDVTLKGAQGHRPLLIWDVQKALDERKRPSGKDEARLALLSVRKGNLTIEGVDIALRWPEAAARPATLLEVSEGDLTVRDCTFSVAGKNRDGVTLARFTGGAEGKGRARLSRCYVRGASLTALDVDAPGAEVLLEDCLLVGGEPPLLKVRAAAERRTGISAVRSTLVCSQNLIELTPAAKGAQPRFAWLGWDVVLSRAGVRAGGELLSVREGGEVRGITWRAHNCIYAGWQSLLAGPKVIAGDAALAWRAAWGYLDGDAATTLPWPQQELNEPATLAKTTFVPEGPVAFAASSSDERPLGCDLSTVPEREGWLLTAIEPVPAAVEAINDSTAPAIPDASDGLYHGERLEVSDLNVGAHLRNVQQKQKLGPRVVLHLSGKGEHVTSPIHIKGSSLLLFFEPPARGEAPLALKLDNPKSAEAMIDVEGGGLDVIGGELRVPDSPPGSLIGRSVPHLLKVRGGDLRLFRCRLEGPQQSLPANYEGLISLEGSGSEAPERARTCAINESILVSGRDGVLLQGGGIRLLIRHSLVVAGSTALRASPGAAGRGKVNVNCVLENVTFAAALAVLRLGDVPEGGPRTGRKFEPPQEPMIVKTQDCAFLNPFFARSNKAGLLIYEGSALARGLLVWHSEGDTFDRRLHFSPWPVGKAPSAKVEKASEWARIWGSHCVRKTRPELVVLRTFAARRWELTFLILPPGRGADLAQLGIKRP